MNRKIRLWRKEFPAVTGCTAGCGRCCGPVPMYAEELAQIERFLEQHDLLHLLDGYQEMFDKAASLQFEHVKCPFFIGTCAVYPVRPLLCRAFAATADPKIQCPFGAHAARPLPLGRTREIMAEYARMMQELVDDPVNGRHQEVLNRLLLMGKVHDREVFGAAPCPTW